jgi:hypothetical protein
MTLPPSSRNDAVAEQDAAAFFRAHGWKVELNPRSGPQALHPDLLLQKGSLKYIAEIKWVSEGRPDRVLATLSKAILQARRYAAEWQAEPLAIVQVSHATELLLQKVKAFQQEFAEGTAIGLMARDGAHHFVGLGLDTMSSPPKPRSSRRQLSSPSKVSDLFSDLNQWMLKVLLAPELPEPLLTAPRGEYPSISALADAAQVSVMSASRFVRSLKEEGFLDDSGNSLCLVRRAELFRRWQAAALRTSPELRMQYVLPASGARQMGEMVTRLQGCIGLFAAADLLRVGHVSGVTPYVFVRRLNRLSETSLRGLKPAGPGEPVHLILKQANTPQSLYRGAVKVDGMPASDVLQIWLDLSAHPSRGAEQADHLKHGVLKSIFGKPP